jgi:hypothetical protein
MGRMAKRVGETSMKTLQPPQPHTQFGGLVALWQWLSVLLWDREPDIGPFEAFINSLEDV